MKPNTLSQKRLIGLMSGTSLDGIDGVLVEASPERFTVTGAAYQAFAPDLREELLALNAPGANEIHRAAMAGQALARAYGALCQVLLSAQGLKPSDIDAIGAHGQTIRHQPHQGYTVQLISGALLAELTAIDTVTDFRSRDIAAGGQGAPLVPAFHQAAFKSPREIRVIVNIGGFANLSVLQGKHAPFGFDSGPGNVLMDAWCERHTGQAFDRNGEWAASGEVNPSLLNTLLAHPYFAGSAPKSTGRDTFHAGWLDQCLGAHPGISKVDVQRTLLELTAQTIADAVHRSAPEAEALYLCGGGARNGALRSRLQALFAPRAVATTQDLGIEVEHVEAAAFAWLAGQTLAHAAGNVPEVTGARGPRVLGAIYPR